MTPYHIMMLTPPLLYMRHGPAPESIERFGSSPTPFPVSRQEVVSLSQSLCLWSSLLTGDGGGGGEEPNHTTTKKVLLSVNNSVLSAGGTEENITHGRKYKNCCLELTSFMNYWLHYCFTYWSTPLHSKSCSLGWASICVVFIFEPTHSRNTELHTECRSTGL
jgi:hypothetical protein